MTHGFKVDAVRSGEPTYMSQLDKLNKKLEEELAAKATHQDPGGQSPSIYTAYTRTNGVSGDNGEGATCIYT